MSAKVQFEAPKELHGKILFPWDGSPLAVQALKLATSLARLLGTEMVLFRALLPPRAELVAAPDLSDNDLSALHHSDAEKEAARLCADCSEEGVKCSPEVVAVDAAREILANLREDLQHLAAAHILRRMAEPDIGLVIIGSHGVSSEERVPRGGVATRVMNEAVKPILIVPLLPSHFPT